jgi:transcriptional regulator with XRE-family HTH domain
MTPVTSLAFGPALKRARRAARLTQAQLTEAAGFSVVYISMLERGARHPQRTTLALLTDALDLSPTERAAWEGAAELGATATPDRHRGRGGTSSLPIGAFLGALPNGPLVGRDAERETIGGALEAVASEQGRFLILVGEPGVGKTRLAQEIVVLARAQGFQLLTGRCYEPQQSLAYAPFLEALAQAVTLLEAEASGQAPVAERWPEVARLLPDYALTTATPSAPNDPNAQQRLFAQVRRLLEALMRRRPLALLLDDLHWADAASLDLLQHLARHTRDQPLLLVGTTRAVEAQRQHPLVDALRDLDRDELLEQLIVQPLAAEETATLIGATLGGADGAQGDACTVSAELATRIQARSEGNAASSAPGSAEGNAGAGRAAAS